MANARAHFLGPHPSGGPGEGPRGQITLNINCKVNFKYLNQILCVFSQMKDTKHFRIFIWSPGICPRGDAGGVRT